MNIFKVAYCRLYQAIFRIGMRLVIHIPVPKVVEGEKSSCKVADILKENNVKKVLVVTDDYLFNSGLMNNMYDSCKENGIECVTFHDVKPNPTIDLIEAGLKIYHENKCEALVAFGGGSPMDCAKGIGARVACPNKSIEKMKGVLHIKKTLPLLIAIPTTAGTGSEATLAMVISNSKTHEKYPINDPVLVPKYAVLDPLLIKDLPGKISSTTGMDALTHAVEAYIGQSNTQLTKEYSIKAVKLIFENLVETYKNPHNMEARNNMLKASYYAGVSFTRAYVGYVHSIAHNLGGFYNVPHGLANSVILPYVLERFGKSAYSKLAELSDVVKLTDSNASSETKAKAFIEAIRNMNKEMNIPTKFEGIIKEEDIPMIIKRADKEGNPLYPVPRIFSYDDFKAVIDQIK